MAVDRDDSTNLSPEGKLDAYLIDVSQLQMYRECGLPGVRS
jgi:hypothetical protein